MKGMKHLKCLLALVLALALLAPMSALAASDALVARRGLDGFEGDVDSICAVGDVIRTTGGACRSDLWLRIRASLLERQLKVPGVVDAAMGSALLAASHDMGGLERAAAEMITYVKSVDPDPALTGPYREIYGKFLEDVRTIYGIRP